jgi:hypothetical protein
MAVLFLLAGRLSAQTINIDAAIRYWELTDNLRRDQPLTDEEWQSFLALPGNAGYVRGIYDADDLARYRRAMEVVYMPRHDSLRQAKLQAKSWFYVLINDYKQREGEFRQYVTQAVQSPDLLANMYQYAYRYLPPRNRTKVADLKLYYGVIGDDATSQADGIFYSLRAAMDIDRIRPGILEAHEMHHQLRTGLDIGELRPHDEGVLWWLFSAHNEGVADLVDKTYELQAPGDPMGIRARLLDPAAAALRRVDSSLVAQAQGGVPAPVQFYRHLSNGSNGHLPGFYMATIIERNGLGKELVSSADDFFTFAFLYQKAAGRDASHPFRFSVQSMRHLQELARYYRTPHSAPAAQATP